MATIARRRVCSRTTLAHTKAPLGPFMLPLQGGYSGQAKESGWYVQPLSSTPSALFSALQGIIQCILVPGGCALKRCTCTSGLAIGMAQVQLKLWSVWSGLVLIQGWQAYRASTPPTGERRRRCSRLFGQPSVSIDGPYGECGMSPPTERNALGNKGATSSTLTLSWRC